MTAISLCTAPLCHMWTMGPVRHCLQTMTQNRQHPKFRGTAATGTTSSAPSSVTALKSSMPDLINFYLHMAVAMASRQQCTSGRTCSRPATALMPGLIACSTSCNCSCITVRKLICIIVQSTTCICAFELELWCNFVWPHTSDVKWNAIKVDEKIALHIGL